MVNTTIATMLREITADAPSTITVFHQQEAPECHHPTYKHLTLGLNHLKECSLTAPTCLFKHEAPECHNTLGNLIYHLQFKHEAPERHHTIGNLIHHLTEEFLVHNHPVVWSL